MKVSATRWPRNAENERGAPSWSTSAASVHLFCQAARTAGASAAGGGASSAAWPVRVSVDRWASTSPTTSVAVTRSPGLLARQQRRVLHLERHRHARA